MNLGPKRTNRQSTVNIMQKVALTILSKCENVEFLLPEITGDLYLDVLSTDIFAHFQEFNVRRLKITNDYHPGFKWNFIEKIGRNLTTLSLNEPLLLTIEGAKALVSLQKFTVNNLYDAEYNHLNQLLKNFRPNCLKKLHIKNARKCLFDHSLIVLTLTKCHKKLEILRINQRISDPRNR